jgi:regulatory protein
MISLKNKALYYLARREYAYHELFNKLKPDYDDEAQIHAVLDELVVLKYLSNERYILSYLNYKSQKYGLQKIRYDLIQKTGDSNLVDNVLNDAKDKLNEYENAHRLWLKRFGIKALDNKELAKQIRYLQYKGFSHDIIKQVLADKLVDEC